VADSDDAEGRTITADQAVELREEKAEPLLLLVDAIRAGAGMDGIYSAAREVDENGLFKEAMRRAGAEVTRSLSGEARKFAEQAIKKARGSGQRYSIPPWTEFDFLVRVAAESCPPGELLHLIGLWPIARDDDHANSLDRLDLSRMFADRLLGTSVAGLPPAQRIAGLRLQQPTEDQKSELERYLLRTSTEARPLAFAELAQRKHLWIGPLRVESAPNAVRSIELVSWRSQNGKLAKWSGLVSEAETEEPSVPVLVLDPDADKTGNYSKLEVRWKVRPDSLGKGTVEYRVAILTDFDEELTAREVSHRGQKEEKCRFSNDDLR
jgi:DNA phosphorothioation-dependent restriction protein DptH